MKKLYLFINEILISNKIEEWKRKYEETRTKYNELNENT